jgi:hypothetical protein
MDNIKDIEELLGREAELSAQQLGNGLSSIRKYSFAEIGYFYTGIFSVTIGLERLLKLVVLFYYKQKNTTYPNNTYLRNKGHDLSDLIKEARSINSINNYGIDESVFEDSLSQVIIEFLKDFAKQSRYYNLDAASGKFQSGNEPLARWDRDVCVELIRRHFKLTEKKKAMFVAQQLMLPASITHTHEDGSSINDPDSYILSCIQINDKQRYSMLYIYRIIRFAVKLFKKIEPFQLWELFVIYEQTDTQALQNKVWDPYKR